MTEYFAEYSLENESFGALAGERAGGQGPLRGLWETVGDQWWQRALRCVLAMGIHDFDSKKSKEVMLWLSMALSAASHLGIVCA